MAALLQSACVTLLLQVAYGGSHTSASFTATNFVKYYQSTTTLAVAGSVSVVQNGKDGQTLSWNLTGIDVKCGLDPDVVGNVCGVHIHVGTSCTADAGGHAHSVATDPWVRTAACLGQFPKCPGVYYNGTKTPPATLLPDPTEATVAIKVITNLTDTQIEGKVIVVHDSVGAGQRIACAVLTRDAPKKDTKTTKPANGTNTGTNKTTTSAAPSHVLGCLTSLLLTTLLAASAL